MVPGLRLQIRQGGKRVQVPNIWREKGVAARLHVEGKGGGGRGKKKESSLINLRTRVGFGRAGKRRIAFDLLHREERGAPIMREEGGDKPIPLGPRWSRPRKKGTTTSYSFFARKKEEGEGAGGEEWKEREKRGKENEDGETARHYLCPSFI